MNNKAKIIGGALAGIAIGAAIGVLLAPDKGSETRKKISQKKDDYIAGLEEDIDDFVELVTAKIKLAKLRAAYMAGIGTHKAADIAERGRQRTEELT